MAWQNYEKNKSFHFVWCAIPFVGRQDKVLRLLCAHNTQYITLNKISESTTTDKNWHQQHQQQQRQPTIAVMKCIWGNLVVEIKSPKKNVSPESECVTSNIIYIHICGREEWERTRSWETDRRNCASNKKIRRRSRNWILSMEKINNNCRFLWYQNMIPGNDTSIRTILMDNRNREWESESRSAALSSCVVVCMSNALIQHQHRT